MGLIKVITAPRGQGKTDFLRQYVNHEVARGRSVGGILAPVVFQGRDRVGYDMVDLRTDSRRSLVRGRQRLGPDGSYSDRWEFNEEMFAVGNDAILRSLREGLDVMVIDEVGPLECDGRGWAPAFACCLEEMGADQELAITVRPSLVEVLPQHFPSALWERAEHISPPWPVLT